MCWKTKWVIRVKSVFPPLIFNVYLLWGSSRLTYVISFDRTELLLRCHFYKPGAGQDSVIFSVEEVPSWGLACHFPGVLEQKNLKLTKSRTIHLTKKCQISFVSLTLLTCHHRAFSRCFHSRTLSALDQSPWKWRTPQPSGTSSSGPSPDCAWPRWHWAWTCQGRAWGAPLCYSNLCPTWKNRYGWISVKWKRLTCPQEDVQAGGFLETPVGHHLQPNDKYKDKVLQMPNVGYIC